MLMVQYCCIFVYRRPYNWMICSREERKGQEVCDIEFGGGELCRREVRAWRRVFGVRRTGDEIIVT